MGQTTSSSAAMSAANNDTNANICEEYSSSGSDDDTSFLEPTDQPLLNDDQRKSSLMNGISSSNHGGSSITSSQGTYDNNGQVDSSFQSGTEQGVEELMENGEQSSENVNETYRNDKVDHIEAPVNTEDSTGTQVPNTTSPSAKGSKTEHNTTGARVQHLSDLLCMKPSEIKERLLDVNFSIESIRSADKIVSDYALISEEELYSWYQEENTIINKNDGSIATSTSYQMSHMEFAVFMLKSSVSLKTLRFKMVPAKIKEAPFWNAVFYLLLSEDEKDMLREKAETAISMNPQNCSLVNDCIDAGANANVLFQNSQEIANLKQKLEDLKQKLIEAEAKAQGSSNLSTHHANWAKDKESLEFLSLDEEIKQKLRDGKQKRLQDVREQMQFILDSDDVKDSRGKWECCGQTTYDQPCTR